jgi:hypothetical protein
LPGIPARAAQHHGSETARLVRPAGDQRGLADAGLAGDQHETAVAVHGAADLGAQQAGGGSRPITAGSVWVSIAP